MDHRHDVPSESLVAAWTVQPKGIFDCYEASNLSEAGAAT